MKAIKYFVLSLAAVWSFSIHSQTLNEQLTELIANGCESFGNMTTFGPVGDNLQAICMNANSSGTASGANSSASSGNVSYNDFLSYSEKTEENVEQPNVSESEYQRLLSHFLSLNVAEQKLTNRVNLFLSVHDGELEKTETAIAEAYTDDFDGQTLGLDFNLTPYLSVGAFGHQQDSKLRFSTGSRSDRESDGYGGYFTARHHSGSYVSGYYFDGKDSYKLNRQIEIVGPSCETLRIGPPPCGTIFPVNGTATANPDGDQTHYQLTTGYSRYFGQGGVSLSLSYNDYERNVDAYEEQGSTGVELNFPNQKIESKLTELTLGGHYRKPIGNTLLVPFAELSYLHESETKPNDVIVSLVEDLRENPALLTISQDELDSDFYKGRIGLSLFFNNGFSITAGYENLFGNDLFDGDMVFLQASFSR